MDRAQLNDAAQALLLAREWVNDLAANRVVRAGSQDRFLRAAGLVLAEVLEALVVPATPSAPLFEQGT